MSLGDRRWFITRAAGAALAGGLLVTQDATAPGKQPISSIKPFTRAATLVVAASDSSPRSRAGADFTADGKDDQQEIQAAIDSLPAGGGTVLLLEGTFNLSGPVMLNKPVRLVGMGSGGWGAYTPPIIYTTLKLVDGANCNALEINPPITVEQIELDDLYLYGNKDNQTATSHGIVVPMSYAGAYFYLVMRQVAVSHFKGDGIRIRPEAKVFVDGWLIAVICSVNDGAGLRLDATLQPLNLLHLTDVRLEVSSPGLHIEGPVYDLTVTGSSFVNNLTENVYLKNLTTPGVVFQGTLIRGGGTRAVSTYPEVYMENCLGVSFMAPQSVTGKWSPPATQAFNMVNCAECQIVSPLIGTKRQGAIRMETCTRCSILGGILRDNCQDTQNTYDEILLTGNTTRCLVEGVTIIEEAANRARYGIAENSPGDDYNRILGNSLEGAATGGILTQGTHSLEANNLT